MIFPKAKKTDNELEYHKTKDGVFGIKIGYFFNVIGASLLNYPKFKFVIATIECISELQKIQIKPALDKIMVNLKFSNFENNENSIFFQFAENLTITKQI